MCYRNAHNTGTVYRNARTHRISKIKKGKRYSLVNNHMRNTHIMFVSCYLRYLGTIRFYRKGTYECIVTDLVTL